MNSGYYSFFENGSCANYVPKYTRVSYLAIGLHMLERLRSISVLMNHILSETRFQK